MVSILQSTVLYYATIIFVILEGAVTLGQQCFSNETDPADVPSANNTGSVTIPGFVYPGMSPNNWTLSLGVVLKNESIESKEQQMIEKTLWMGTNPAENLSSPDLAFGGCAILYSSSNRDKSTASTGSGNQSCNGVLDSACQEYLLSEPAIIYKSIRASGLEIDCNQIAHNIYNATKSGSTPCGQLNSYQYDVPDENIFGNARYISLNYGKGPLCSRDVSAGDPRAGWLLQDVGVGYQKIKDAKKDFKSIVKDAVPVILVGWPSDLDKDGTVSSSLVCIAPNNGSPDSGTSSAVIVTAKWRWKALVAFGIMVAATLYI